METSLKSGFERLGELLRDHWLVLIVLATTATRTYDIVWATSPVFYLPFISVMIMEGSWFFWNDHTTNAKRPAQKWIAIIATAVTWLTILLTVAADAVWQASQRGLFEVRAMPAWANDVAVYGVITIGMVHIGLQVLYHYIDPEAELRRERARLVREADHAGKKAQLDMERAALDTEIQGLRNIMPKAAQLFGTLAFNDRFFERFHIHPDDLNTKEVRDLIKLLDRTGKYGNNQGHTMNQLPETITPADSTPLEDGGAAGVGGEGQGPITDSIIGSRKARVNHQPEVGGGVDHRNFTQPGNRS